MKISIDLSDLKRVANNIGQPKIIESEIRKAMEDALAFTEGQVSMRTDVGATGDLRAGIVTEITGLAFSGLRGKVVDPIKYAECVEVGTVPHWAPIAPLKLWAKRILGDESAAYAIQRKIAFKGTKGQHMFRDGFRASEGYIKKTFAGVTANVIKRLGFK